MKIMEIAGARVGFIGDVHLGRTFKTGVPLERQGEREASVFNQFSAELVTPDLDFNICLGDIFDQYVVAPEYVLRVAMAYRTAAKLYPDTIFVMVRGNHDASRNADKASSYDLLHQLLFGIDNVVVSLDNAEVVEKGNFRLGVLPWHPFINSKEMARTLGAGTDFMEYDLVVGHWDRVTFEEQPHNAIPMFELRPFTKLVVSGHDHRPFDEEINGIRVVFPGSMQPYSHGEDPDEQIYVTYELEELKTLLMSDPTILHDNAVRVLLKPGEQIDFPIDAWSVTTKPIAANGEDFVDITMQVESFDMEDILGRCFNKHGVSKTVTSNLLAKYLDKRNAA
jgi:DNA repair exonuclease SbcCD nuclease subunit